MRAPALWSLLLGLTLAPLVLGGAGCGAPPESLEPEAPAPPAPPRPAPALGPGPHHGIDVSHHSGAVDWSQVADGGYRFVFLKASEGVDDPDPMFAEHWRRAGESGLVRGAYHFYVTEDDPDEQAELFLTTIDLGPGDLPPVVDIELLGHGTKGDLQAPLQRFLDRVEKEVGVRPILYTSPTFWDTHFHESFREYPLWIAEYGVDEPTIPEGWTGWTLWQYQGDAEVPGVEKGADRSKSHPELNLDALRLPSRLR